MDIIITIVIGFIVGAVAKFLMPGKDPGGFIITILLGIGGSYLAAYVGGQLNIYPAGSFCQFIAAVIGAVVLLILYRLIFKRK